MHVNELETPVAIVDLDRLDANIARLQSHLEIHGIDNRPHIKTHKIPEIAHMQIDAGAVGITCQKLGEAEVMVQAGIKDVFIPYNILGASKLERLTHLTRRATISVTTDSKVTVQGLSDATTEEGTTLAVLVEFDTGMGRCGVQTPDEAAALARCIDDSPGLQFAGLMTFPCNENTDPFVREVKELLAGDGITVDRVSGGSTANMWKAQTFEELTEYRAGMYVYGDRYTVNAGALDWDDCVLSVITTVVSRPTEERGILDGGSKTFSSDTVGLDGFGRILEYPQANFYSMSEEHGHVDFSACDEKPAIGERVTVIPNHSCVVSNLFDHIVGVRGDTVEVVWPVAARGAVR